MKTFVLNEDQRMVKELLDELVEAEIRSRSEEIDHKQKYPAEGIQVLAESGLIACMIPEKYNGSELDYLSHTLVIEEVAKECGSTAFAIAQICEAAEVVLKHGSEEAKSRYLPTLVCGTPVAVGGSDRNVNNSFDVTVTAEKTEEGYVLNGLKKNVFHANAASWFIIAAKEDDEVKWFIVDNKNAGITISDGDIMLGFKGCKVGSLSFNEYKVPETALLKGNVEATLKSIQALNMAAISSGIAQGALNEAIEYVNQRVQFKKTIAQFQNTQQVGAELLAKSEASRALVWEAARVKDAGEESSYVASLAKIIATEAAAMITKKCVQFMGGYGYSREYPVERKMRDAKMAELLNGSSFLQKDAVAKMRIVK